MHKRLVLGMWFVSSALAAQDGTTSIRPQDPLSVAKTTPESPWSRPTQTATPGGRAESAKSARPAGGMSGGFRLGVLFDAVGDDLWVAADAWKACFSTSGVDFLPFLGSQASQDWPVRFELRGVSVGGRVLPIAKASPLREEMTVSYRRGSLVESYEALDAGLEQRFRFDTLPERGELMISIAFDGVMQTREGEHGLDFTCADGSFRYGSAVAIDARGDRIAVERRVSGGAIELVVPAGFVSRAALPLIVDPLIGNAHSFLTGQREFSSVDVTWSETDQKHVVVCQSKFSQTDYDVHAMLLDAAGTGTQMALTVDATAASWSHCRIASLQKVHSHLVVAQASTGNVAPFRIMGRRIVTNPFSFSIDPAFEIASSGNPSGVTGDCTNPDVGGDASDLPSEFKVVWERSFSAGDHDIEMRGVSWLGTLSSAVSDSLDRSTGFETEPAISKSNGAGALPRTWAVAYRRTNLALGTGHMRAAFVDSNGQIHTFGQSTSTQISNQWSTTSGGWDVSSPTDPGVGGLYLCAHTETAPANGLRVIVGEVFDSAGTMHELGQTIIRNDYRPQFDVDSPAVDSDGCRFAVCYRRTWDTATGDIDVGVRTMGLLGSTLITHDDQYPAASQAFEGSPAVVAMRSGGGAEVDYLVACVLRVSAAQWDVLGQRYRGFSPIGGFAARATGCGSTSLVPGGEPILGTRLSMDVTAPFGALGLLVGLPASLPFPDCTCLLGVDGLALSGSHFEFTVPCDTALVYGYLAFQGFAVGSGSCLGTIGLSDTIDARFQ